MLLDEDRMQRRVKVLPIADARGLHRGERIEHRARSERHARLTQGAGEVDDVLRQRPAAGGLGFRKRAHFPAGDKLVRPCRPNSWPVSP